jgi:hypothetical protein
LNFLFEFNSFIETNDYGGYIIINATTFERFGTCGAIVRNFRESLSIDDISNLLNNTPSLASPQKVFYERSSRLQLELDIAKTARLTAFSSGGPFKNSCTKDVSLVTSLLPACYSLLIS